jgi:transcriptional regulator with XRE-family HTH domain
MQHTKLPEITTMAISPDERAFFAQLGARISNLRTTQGITQVQMADELGVSQQTINSYEVARRRVPVSALPVLAKIFDMTIDELLGEHLEKKTNKRGPASKLEQQIERVNALPRSKQKFVMEMIETVIQQAS